ncbi:E3 ubiquitin-protein ligase RDUF2 (RING and DUF1117 domain-containing protein 2) (AtRDUF2) (RING-type E3 ubiquitin transferase RDUF2) [Durusdinium trenchii]|uniref:E3 ubiquitin-protein ligase RDUF2 (RING and DUF1117 domain-containing protein 2) (AtRDUF2) (RING-type E3 ubiquitin transferase RDUF2) n=1 Tax=Durusdinium trenchii TaxID=1381693 RepID=A0ABP0MLL7_9DINO
MIDVDVWKGVVFILFGVLVLLAIALMGIAGFSGQRMHFPRPDIKTIKELVKRSIEKQIDLVDVADCPSPERTCAICLEELQGNEHVRQLPCQHCYHEECLVTWGASGYFGVSNTARLACPLCRKDHTIDVEV